MLQKAGETDYININCVDPLGRSALLMAIDNENLEMVELLINHRVDTKDALLHAISEEFVEAVEVLLDHEDCSHRDGDPHVSRLFARWNVAQLAQVQGKLFLSGRRPANWFFLCFLRSKLSIIHRVGKHCRTTQPHLRQVLKIFIISWLDLRWSYGSHHEFYFILFLLYRYNTTYLSSSSR